MAEPGSAPQRPVGARFHVPERVERPSPTPDRFARAVRGYRRDEVDRRIDELEAEIADLRRTVELLREEAAATAAAEASVAEGHVFADKLARLERREAESIKQLARTEAGRVLEDARRTAEALVRAAHAAAQGRGGPPTPDFDRRRIREF